MAKTKMRNSGVELLKIAGIFLIVVNHVVQTLSSGNAYIPFQDYVLNISGATTSISVLILAMLRYTGYLGNYIFFVSSAWFLQDSSRVNKRKVLQMILDIWVISVLLLVTVYVLRGGSLDRKLMVLQLVPTTMATNWYTTCYLLFYGIHPCLNWILDRMDQKTLLRSVLVMGALYIGLNFVSEGRFYATRLVTWITVYFAIAYMKRYLPDASASRKGNAIAFVGALVCNCGLILLTDFLGLKTGSGFFDLLRWHVIANPFLIVMAVSLLNLARGCRFESRAVNYIAGFSLLIYLFHENMLLRVYYRPLLWDAVYNRFGYDHVLAWTFVLAVGVFLFGLAAGILYRYTLQRLVTRAGDRLYAAAGNLCNRIEKRILKLH